MTPAEIRRIRKRFKLTQRQFAERLGVHYVTVRKWEAGMQAIRNTHATLIQLVVEKEIWLAERGTARRKAKT